MNCFWLAYSPGLTASLTRYIAVEGSSALNATEANVSVPISDAIDIKSVYVKSNTGWGGNAGQLKIGVMDNGALATGVEVILQSAISGSVTPGSPYSIAANRTVSIRIITPSGSMPTSLSILIFYTCSAGQVITFIQASTISATTFFGLQGAGSSSATEAQVYSPLGAAGTFQNLRVKVSAAPGIAASGKKWTITARGNTTENTGGNTTLTCDILETATTGSDTSHTPSVAAGCLASIGIVATSSPAAAILAGSMTFVPTTAGEACMQSAHSNTATGGSTNNFAQLSGFPTSWNTTEDVGSPQSWMRACTLKALYVRTSSGLGAGSPTKQSDVCPCVGGTDKTALKVSITGNVTTFGKTTGQSVAIADGDALDISIRPTNTPSAVRHQMGMCYSIVTEIITAVAQASEGGETGGTVIPVRIIRPNTTISTGSWRTDTGATGLHLAIDEKVADDADYIQSALSPTSADVCEVSLDPVLDPGRSNDGSDHRIHYRYQKDASGGDTINLTVRLMQGTTEIANWAHTNISNGFTEAEQVLTDGQANSITDYGDLRLRFESIKV